MTCHLPIHICHAETGRPVAVLLASRQAALGRELRAIMRVVMRRLRRAWPRTTVTWRGDARSRRQL
jgi:3-deoxy-D-arabino-heptulosonate 7-phosphate (DAHP) synthase